MIHYKLGHHFEAEVPSKFDRFVPETQKVDLRIVRQPSHNLLSFDVLVQVRTPLCGQVPKLRKSTDLYQKIRRLTLEKPETKVRRRPEMAKVEGFEPETQKVNLRIVRPFVHIVEHMRLF